MLCKKECRTILYTLEHILIHFEKGQTKHKTISIFFLYIKFLTRILGFLSRKIVIIVPSEQKLNISRQFFGGPWGFVDLSMKY